MFGIMHCVFRTTVYMALRSLVLTMFKFFKGVHGHLRTSVTELPIVKF
jgi:hypothetical protein